MGTFDFPAHLKGDTFEGASFAFSTGDPLSAMELSGCFAEIKFRRDKKTGIEADYLTTTNGRLSAEGNTVSILPFIIDWPPGKYVYDLQMTTPDSFVQTYVGGSIVIEQDVTY